MQSSTPKVVPGAALPWLQLGRVGGFEYLMTYSVVWASVDSLSNKNAADALAHGGF